MLIPIENTPFTFETARYVNVQCVSHIQIAMEIVLVSKGSLTVTVGKKDYEVKNGEGIFIPPFTLHKFHSEQYNESHVLIFSDELVGELFSFLNSHSIQNHIFSVSNAVCELVDTILPEEKNNVDAISAKAVLAPLCYDIMRGCKFKAIDRPSYDTMYKAVKYIDEHFLEEITLESVAKAIGVHPVTISKLFANRAGISFNYYVQYQRCSHAITLMKKREMNFAEIAYESGFGSIRSFNRTFQTIYGMTPSKYRNMTYSTSLVSKDLSN